MMSEIKTLDEMNGRLDISEEKFSELGGITAETIDEIERNKL